MSLRVPDWEVRLNRWATLRNGEPFVWGQSDCVLLCFEAFDQMIGTQLADTYRGEWYSKETAELKQRTAGISFLADTLSLLGCEEITPGFQQRGDFVIVEKWPLLHAHVCFGNLCLSSCPEYGVKWGRINFAVPDGLQILRAR